MRVLFFLIIIISALLSGCLEIKNSVFDTYTEMTRNWNNNFQIPNYNLAGGDVVRFALFTDSHQNYQDLDDTINIMNASDLDFAIHLGDFTDMGTRDEYEIFQAFLEDLNIPSWIVPGNHDLATAKSKLFQKIYGVENSSLVTSFGKMIFWNSNALELRPATADLDFLDQEITSASITAPVFVFQHQDPINTLTYTSAERTRISTILNSHPQVLVFHGHLHRFDQTSLGATALTFQINRVEGRKWAYVEVDNTNFRVFYCSQQNCEKVYEAPTL